MTTAASTTFVETSLAVATVSASFAVTSALFSKVADEFSDKIDYYNRIHIPSVPLTNKKIEELVKEATNNGLDTNEKIIVNLGRTDEYEYANDEAGIKKVIFKFDKSRWNYLVKTFDEEGMWLVNLFFLKYAYNLEKHNKLEFRLLSDYQPFENNYIHYDQPGGFYSRKLKFLRATNHEFGMKKITNSNYEVWIRNIIKR